MVRRNPLYSSYSFKLDSLFYGPEYSVYLIECSFALERNAYSYVGWVFPKCQYYVILTGWLIVWLLTSISWLISCPLIQAVTGKVSSYHCGFISSFQDYQFLFYVCEVIWLRVCTFRIIRSSWRIDYLLLLSNFLIDTYSCSEVTV